MSIIDPDKARIDALRLQGLGLLEAKRLATREALEREVQNVADERTRDILQTLIKLVTIT